MSILLYTFYSFKKLNVCKIHTELLRNFQHAFNYYIKKSLLLLHILLLNKNQYQDSILGNLICKIIISLIFIV